MGSHPRVLIREVHTAYILDDGFATSENGEWGEHPPVSRVKASHSPGRDSGAAHGDSRCVGEWWLNSGYHLKRDI